MTYIYDEGIQSAKVWKKEYEFQCVKEGCHLCEHDSKRRWKPDWQWSIFMEYNYTLECVEQSHRNLTPTLIANRMYGYIIDKIDFEPKPIIN